MKPIVTSSEIVHQNPWYHVRKDTLIWPNGNPGEYYVTELPDSVCVICVKGDQVLTSQQYRHTIGLSSIEFPTGRLEKQEEPLLGGKRELEEETGFVASHWTKLGALYGINGAIHSCLHVFCATDIRSTKTHLDTTEINSGLSHTWMPISKWEASILNGEITDQESIAAWCLYKLHRHHSAAC